jgi:hypothetical protein
MSQLFVYFVCPQAAIERWAEALARRDEDLRRKIESDMDRVVTLKNLGQDDFNLLARCVAGGDIDVVRAVGDVDPIKAVSEDEGPWVLAFRQPAVIALAQMNVDEPLLRRWAEVVARFKGKSANDYRGSLTADVARTLREMCALAVRERLGVFCCFYG